MKSLIIRTINLAAVLAILFSYNVTASDRKAVEEEVARLYAEQEALLQDGGSFKDGAYEGTAIGFGGDVSVEVIVEDGTIQEIKIVSAENEDAAYMEMAKDIIPVILEKQSADVDTVSGATFSSTGIKDAVAAALEKAE